MAKDKNGATVFDGPINTEEQLKAVPEAIRAKLKRMEAHANVTLPRSELHGAQTAPAGPPAGPKAGI